MKWLGKIPAKIYRVKSKSNPAIYHRIELWKDGSFTCSCMSFLMRRKCSHIEKVKEHIKNNNNK
jgi:hypothetical protein